MFPSRLGPMIYSRRSTESWMRRRPPLHAHKPRLRLNEKGCLSSREAIPRLVPTTIPKKVHRRYFQLPFSFRLRQVHASFAYESKHLLGGGAVKVHTNPQISQIVVM